MAADEFARVGVGLVERGGDNELDGDRSWMVSPRYSFPAYHRRHRLTCLRLGEGHGRDWGGMVLRGKVNVIKIVSPKRKMRKSRRRGATWTFPRVPVPGLSTPPPPEDHNADCQDPAKTRDCIPFWDKRSLCKCTLIVHAAKARSRSYPQNSRNSIDFPIRTAIAIARSLIDVCFEMPFYCFPSAVQFSIKMSSLSLVFPSASPNTTSFFNTTSP